MAEDNPNHTEDPNKPAQPIETDYEAHSDNPGPAPTVNEPNNKGAGQMLKWILPVAVIILIIFYLIYFRDNTNN